MLDFCSVHKMVVLCLLGLAKAFAGVAFKSLVGGS